MDSGFHTHAAEPVFINQDTGVTASENLFRLMVLRMTGLKDAHPNFGWLHTMVDSHRILLHTRAKGWIGGTYQQRNRLRRATVPLIISILFTTCWRLHAVRLPTRADTGEAIPGR